MPERGKSEGRGEHELEMIFHPSVADFDQLYRDCLESDEEMAHLNAFSYPDAWDPDGEELLEQMKELEQCYLLRAEGSVVGLLNYGDLIPWQPNAFGVAIGQKFTGRGYATQALALFLKVAESLGVQEVNGYCLPEHTAMIRVMEGNEMVKDDGYEDPQGAGSVRYFVERG